MSLIRDPINAVIFAPSSVRPAIIRVCMIQSATSTLAGINVAGTWGKRVWGNVACLVGAHDWSGWQVLDPDRPSEQVRICARCSRMKNNTAPPIKVWNRPFT